jgi:repressor LexA
MGADPACVDPAMPMTWTFQHRMKVAPHPFENLDFKAAQRLVRARFTSREQVLEAVQAGRLSSFARERPRQYGRIHHQRVLAWLGLAVEDPLPLKDWHGITAPSKQPGFTPRQGQYLAFIHYYTKVNGRPPAEADFQRFFQVSPPAVHDMIVLLEHAGWISRVPGQGRSIMLKLTRDQLPDLE